VGNEVAGEEQVVGGGDEVSCLVPEVGKAQQWQMQEPERGEDEGKPR